MKYLHVFDGVPIPVDYASTQTYALLAKRDGGKTYTTLLFEEQLCDAGLFFVTLDPVGKHWALRAGADGSERGGKRDVFVLGGLHGDVPLEASSGELIADVVVDHPGQYVLDVSTFDTDADQDRFALAFAQRLFRRKAKDPGFPLTLILEEAEAFIPERFTSGQAKMLGAFGRIMRQGRNHGLGMWMVAQRAQALNKGVLSQAEVLIVKQMAHPRDLAAVEAWVKANGTPEEHKKMMEALASLQQDEAFVWSPSWLRVFDRTRVPQRVTFDSSASVKGGQEARSVQLVPLDVEALGQQIARTAERAKAEDPKELRKQLAEVKRELAKRPTETKVETVTEQIEVPVLANGVVGRLEKVTEAIADAASQLGDVSREIRGDLRRVGAPSAATPRAAARRPSSSHQSPQRRATAAEQPPRSENGSNEVQLKAGARRMLSALASLHPTWLTRAQVGTLAKVKHTGGTFGDYLSALRTAGAIEETGTGRSSELRITEHGFELLGTEAPAPATPDELLAMWRDRLKRGAREMLDELVSAYPEWLSREDLAAAAGLEVTGGTFGDYLSMLRRAGLIQEDKAKNVSASDTLFMGAPA